LKLFVVNNELLYIGYAMIIVITLSLYVRPVFGTVRWWWTSERIVVLRPTKSLWCYVLWQQHKARRDGRLQRAALWWRFDIIL